MGTYELSSPIRTFPSSSSSAFSLHLLDVGIQQSLNCVSPYKQVFLGTYTAKSAALGTKSELILADFTALSREGFECPPNRNMLKHHSTQAQTLKQDGSILRIRASYTPFSKTLFPNSEEKLGHSTKLERQACPCPLFQNGGQ